MQSNITQSLRINLPLFEGPLDLLLYLIKKDDLNIYDIPMAHVLGQYLEYLELLEELNIDTAGEFLLMAAELTHIKSRLLVHQPGEDIDEGGDPRAELVARLLEYQKYKRAATWLHKNPMLNRDFYIRPEVIGEAHTEEAPVVFEAGSVDPFGLIRAFQEILKKIPKDKAHAIETERVSVTDRIYEIVDRLKQKETIAFTELFEAMSSRLQLVVTFLALLEMAKLKMIHIQQMEENREIWISRKMTIDEGLGKLHVTVDAKEEGEIIPFSERTVSEAPEVLNHE